MMLLLQTVHVGLGAFPLALKVSAACETGKSIKGIEGDAADLLEVEVEDMPFDLP